MTKAPIALAFLAAAAAPALADGYPAIKLSPAALR
jgi:hypothetical protein